MMAVSGPQDGQNQTQKTSQPKEKPRLARTSALGSRRERVIVAVFSWLIAISLHVVAYLGFSAYLDYQQVSFDLDIAWDDAPLSGFGMMDAYWAEAPSEGLEDIAYAEPDESPFERPEAELEPKIDAASIEAPEVEEVQAPNPELPQSADAPKYDLSKDKARLAALREDMASMPNLPTMAPGNAKLIALIRNDRIRGTRFESAVRKLLRSFPDYQVTLGKSDIDPLNAINALLIATSNPQLYAETFLVVSHHIANEQLKDTITDSFPVAIKWETFRGRPLATPDPSDGKYGPNSGIYQRSVYLPNDNLVLFLRPEVLPSLSESQIAGLLGDAQKLGSPEDNENAKPIFLDNLAGIDASDSVSGPTLFLALQGIDGLSFGPQFPKFAPPIGIQASMSTSDSPQINMALSFMTAKEASDFIDIWPDIASAAGKMGIPGLGGMFSGLSLASEESRVFVTGQLNGTFVSLVLLFASSRLESLNR